MSGTTKQQTELDTYTDIAEALKQRPVWCDIVSPKAVRIPVRDVRRFRTDKSLAGISPRDPRWTDLAHLGNLKGYEVLTLEGWHVPERVYIEL